MSGIEYRFQYTFFSLSFSLFLSRSLPRGGVTRQGVVLTDLQSLLDSLLSCSLSLSHSLRGSAVVTCLRGWAVVRDEGTGAAL